MPKSVLSSCMPRNALANRCCSGDSDSMASRNSLGVGICSSRSGISSRSLFCTMMAWRGSNVSADAILPTSKMKLLNWRARATSVKAALDDENWCAIQPWR